MPSLIKERISEDLKQVKEVGQSRVERIREIVKGAVSQVISEVKVGSSDIRSVVQDAVLAVVENIRSKGDEAKEEVTASIEGAIEGVNQSRRQLIAKTQTEVKQLQAQIDEQEGELQTEVEEILSDVEKMSHEVPSNLRQSLESALKGLQNSEEASLLKKRYAQLQAQLAIVRANFAARSGGSHEEIQSYLDEAQSWYQQIHAKAEPVANQVKQQQAHLEAKLGEAGSALARRESRVRHILSDLLQSAADFIREKQPTKQPTHKE